MSRRHEGLGFGRTEIAHKEPHRSGAEGAKRGREHTHINTILCIRKSLHLFQPRQNGNLSSALRLFVLEYYRDKAAERLIRNPRRTIGAASAHTFLSTPSSGGIELITRHCGWSCAGCGNGPSCSNTWPRSQRSIQPPQAGHLMKCSASSAGGSPRRIPMYLPRGIVFSWRPKTNDWRKVTSLAPVGDASKGTLFRQPSRMATLTDEQSATPLHTIERWDDATGRTVSRSSPGLATTCSRYRPTWRR
jgi:hypothetical protein